MTKVGFQAVDNWPDGHQQLMKKPNFFIVGKPKSGTTALHSMLNQHPDIYMSPYKEPHHFHRDYMEEAERRNRGYMGLPYKELDRYLELFDGADTQKIVGESSTGYLYSRLAASEIAQFDPDAKILMVLREPVDFIHSLHSQYLRSGNETEKNFRKALQLEDERKRGQSIPSTTAFPSNLFYTEQAKYCEQVERYLDAFDRSQVKIIIFEDLRADNPGVLKEILEFLGVDSGVSLEPKKVNVREEMRFIRLANWLIYHGERKKGAFKQWAPEWLLAPVRTLFRRLIFTEVRPEQLDSRLRAEFAPRFKPEVERLGDILGVDLVEKWGYGDY